MRQQQRDVRTNMERIQEANPLKGAFLLISVGVWGFEASLIILAHLGWNSLKPAGSFDRLVILVAYVGPWVASTIEWVSIGRRVDRTTLSGAGAHACKRSILKVLWPTYIVLSIVYCYFFKVLAA